MTGRLSSRTLIALAALSLAGADAVGAQVLQAPQAPRPTPPMAAAVPVLLPPPALAPAPPVRGAVRSVASVGAPNALMVPIVAPRGTGLPDSITRGRARIALASPTPLVREAPVRRVREFGPVRNDVALQPAPAGATGRCRDGTYLTTPPSEEACTGKGGLSIRVPPPQAAPPSLPRRP